MLATEQLVSGIKITHTGIIFGASFPECEPIATKFGTQSDTDMCEPVVMRVPLCVGLPVVVQLRWICSFVHVNSKSTRRITTLRKAQPRLFLFIKRAVFAFA